MIRAKDFFEELIKGVFGFWSFSVGATKPEDVGRTYFYDHRNEEAPFTADCIGKIRILYEYTFQYKLDVDPTDISSNLCALIKEHFGTDFSYLIFRDDDTPELSNTKRNFWEQIMEKLYTHLNRKKNIDEKVISYTREDKTARQDIERLAKGTKTEGYLKALEENKSTDIHVSEIHIPAKDDFTSNLSILKMMANGTVIDTTYDGGNKGGCLFFLDSPYLDIYRFIQEYRDNVVYKSALTPFPKVYIKLNSLLNDSYEKKEIWRHDVNDGNIIPVSETLNTLIGYDIKKANMHILEYKDILFVQGDMNLYKEILKHIVNVAVIILLPNTYHEISSEEYERLELLGLLDENHTEDNRMGEILDYNNSLDFFIRNEIPYVYTMRWNPYDEDTNNTYHTAYCSGIIDTIVSRWHPFTAKNEAHSEMRNCMRAGLNLIYGNDD